MTDSSDSSFAQRTTQNSADTEGATDAAETSGTDSSALTDQERALVSAVEAALPSSIAELSDLVRIPSVSWAAFDPANVAASAEAVAGLARATGVFESVDILRAATPSGELGQPAVLATRAARNGRPTVLLYAHHDVQPPGDDAAWESLPFEPTVRGDRLYGRGAADDKAGVESHLAAIRALTATAGDDFDLGLVLFIEGEEEFGSRSFANFLEANRDRLAADVIVVADSDNWDTETPSLTISLRGNVTFKLTVSTLAHASHSGMFGGAVPDAMLAAFRLLASFHDENGSVAVVGLTGREIEAPEYTEETLRAEAGLLDGVKPIGEGSILSRLWSKPTVTVTGIDAPSVANASNTLIPSVAVRVSARIAPGQDSQQAFEALEAHVRAHTPFGAHVEITEVDTGSPFLVDTSGWAVTAAKDAMRDAWGAEPVEAGIGGSIPFIADLVRVFPEAQILVTGVEDPHTRAHSPNESLHLGVFKRAITAEALLLLRLNSRTGNS
ncbi:dipeptidase [Herbiconiux solani]|uniref:dipeptidase n=1 Tax=Herbiconiux solani TaxID=661329 RepID=UPI000A0756BB|nr:dipeptidase [Herbiconiux solani]